MLASITMGLMVAAICLLSFSAYIVSASGAPTGKATNSKYLAIVKHAFRFNNNTFYDQNNIVGVIANKNKLTISNIYVLGQIFDRNGQLITSNWATPDFTTLRPGENSTFKLPF
jgi:hypothetical protein